MWRERSGESPPFRPAHTTRRPQPSDSMLCSDDKHPTHKCLRHSRRAQQGVAATVTDTNTSATTAHSAGPRPPSGPPRKDIPRGGKQSRHPAGARRSVQSCAAPTVTLVATPAEPPITDAVDVANPAVQGS